MARYLVVHSPINAEDDTVRQPSNLVELALLHGGEAASPRWLKTWSPDLNDDRIFTLWNARDASEIQTVLGQYGFLDHMMAQPLRVQEWGPEDVLAVERGTELADHSKRTD